MKSKSLAELQADLAEALQRERRYGRMALQDGITGEERAGFRDAELSARAEVKLRQRAIEHATGRS
jgi:hypothetical protein